MNDRNKLLEIIIVLLVILVIIVAYFALRLPSRNVVVEPLVNPINQPYQNVDAPSDGLVGCTPTSKPSITVTNPESGSRFNIGENMDVRWMGCNLPSNATVRIELYSPQIAGGAISVVDPIDGITNDGQESVYLDPQLQPTILSGVYTVRVSAGGVLGTVSNVSVFN
jgi:hypothetical protein